MRGLFPCAAACPSNCIYIEAAENTEENRVSGAERYAKVYNIDYNRCIFCGYCVEACPTDAITHGHGFELATFNASNLGVPQGAVAGDVPAHMGPNAVFNGEEVGSGCTTANVARPALNALRFSMNQVSAGPQRPAFLHSFIRCSQAVVGPCKGLFGVSEPEY